MARLRSVQLLLGVGTTAPLLEHVQLLQSLTSRLRHCLPHEAANHVQVANLNSERLVIQVDSTAWATRLRYLGPQLLRCLRKNTGLPPYCNSTSGLCHWHNRPPPCPTSCAFHGQCLTAGGDG
ncbi:DUF721 domain-containing protein [Sulfurivermis fontis]|uniref:DciA family protein n=1 Tax=Sulfurivermis fontis TaxID=1972068 RepID=UPI001558B961